MNSRDAAYEEQVKAALEASRIDNATEAIIDDEFEEKGKEKAGAAEEDAEEKLPARKGKRKREDDDNGMFTVIVCFANDLDTHAQRPTP